MFDRNMRLKAHVKEAEMKAKKDSDVIGKANDNRLQSEQRGVP